MGYEPEDLPWEVPLIELGLDSLMAVRIKNRVEYDFDLPPIQLTAVRDANLYNIETLIQYAVEHRDEVEQLHEHQKTLTADEIAQEQARLLSGATVDSVTAPAPDPQAEPQTQPAPPSSDAPIPPPPTDPSGPSGNGATANLAGALSQEAVSKALNSDVPRVTPPSGSPSPPGRSSPASRRAASSTRCPSSTRTPRPRWRSASRSVPTARSPPRTC